ncbi:hypothetical protein CN918_31045 [Priestia megaterium]|nr:hypothetical protein CN918_31045 [Priestia megaterium]
MVLLLVFGGTLAYFLIKGNNAGETIVDPKEKNEGQQVFDEKKIDRDDVKPFEQNVESFKTWEYSFGRALDPNSISDSSVSITNDKGKTVEVSTTLVNANKTIRIAAPVNGYVKGKTYNIDMNQELKYTTGQPVSKPYHLTFTVKRDEVEEVVLIDGLIVVKSEDLTAKTDTTLTIKKSVKEDLKAGDIVVIPSKEFKEGEAFKVADNISSSGDNFKVEVVKPEFSELFEKLNINKEYDIKPENVTPNSDIPGITMRAVAQETPKTMIASLNGEESNEEFALTENLGMSYSKKKGFTFALNEVKLFEENPGLNLSGDITFSNPKVDVDIDMKYLNIKKFHFAETSHAEANVHLNTDEMEWNLEEENKPQFIQKLQRTKEKTFPEKRLKLGSYNVPIPAFPAITVKGTILLNFEMSMNGQVAAEAVFEVDDITGVHYEKKKMKPISKTDIKTEFSAEGNAQSEMSIGPAGDVGLYGLGVLGGGVEVYGGLKNNLDVVGGVTKEQEWYACGEWSYGPFIESSVYVDTVNLLHPSEPQRLFEHTFFEPELKPFKTINTCDALEKMSSKTKTLSLKAGEQINLDVLGTYANMLSKETKTKKLKNFADVSVTSSNTGVITLSKSKNGKTIIIQGNKLPSKKTTILKITYKELSEPFYKVRTKTITIPVTISDFEKVQRERVNFAGQWSRNIAGMVGHLNITNLTENTFKYSMTVRASGYIGETATVTGNRAVSNPWGNCQVSFDLKGDVMEVTESDGCGEGENIPDWTPIGTYERGAPKVSEEPSEGQMFFD